MKADIQLNLILT